MTFMMKCCFDKTRHNLITHMILNPDVKELQYAENI